MSTFKIIAFLLDGSETAVSYIRGMVFVEFWMRPKINPFDDVRLCALNHLLAPINCISIFIKI